MKFIFRLEKVLKIIQIREMAKKNEIFRISRKIEDLKTNRTALESNIAKLLGEDSAGLRAEWVPYKATKIPMDAEDIRRIERNLREERKNLEMRKEELGRIVMRRKGLDSLRQKRLHEFRIQRDRVLQKRLDEMHRLLRSERN